MASKDHKIVRRAEALNELSRLSGLLAGRLNVASPDVQSFNRDSELAEIQRIEGINGLLSKLLEASQQDADKAAAKKPVKHGTGK
jgi:hypothetical protein